MYYEVDMPSKGGGKSKSLLNSPIHIKILIIAKPSSDDEAWILASQFVVLAIQLVVASIVDWIIWLFVDIPIGGILASDDGFGGLLVVEVLVLDDAGVWYFSIGKVHYGNALIVVLVENLGLEIERTVLERAVAIVEESVYLARV